MYIAALGSLGMGFYKMFAYENSEYSFGTKTNVYVGGDAYNYIINGTYATGFFVLFGAFLIAGLLIELKTTISKMSMVNNGVHLENTKEEIAPQTKIGKFIDEIEIR